jgi:hypothetical protein
MRLAAKYRSIDNSSSGNVRPEPGSVVELPKVKQSRKSPLRPFERSVGHATRSASALESILSGNRRTVGNLHGPVSGGDFYAGQGHRPSGGNFQVLRPTHAIDPSLSFCSSGFPMPGAARSSTEQKSVPGAAPQPQVPLVRGGCRNRLQSAIARWLGVEGRRIFSTWQGESLAVGGLDNLRRMVTARCSRERCKSGNTRHGVQ